MLTESLALESLASLVGCDLKPQEVNVALRSAVQRAAPPAVGALHVTCSDESEREVAESFGKHFAGDTLPRLKYGSHAPMRTANLGARYEWTSVRLAEAHFATSTTRMDPGRRKIVVVKLNSHVAVETHLGQSRYGRLHRYGVDSPCCGMVAATLAGDGSPPAQELRELLLTESVDRLAQLAEIAPERRLLMAALCSARLQARKVVLDIQGHRPAGPTLYLIVPAVTLNRPGPDGELVCGLYRVERDHGTAEGSYLGLGDRPAEYRVEERHGRLTVTTEQETAERPIRDHRLLVGSAYSGLPKEELGADPRIEQLLGRARERPSEHLESALLKSLLLVLAEVAPVPAALLLFAEGGVEIFHAWRAHRLAAAPPKPTTPARSCTACWSRSIGCLPRKRSGFCSCFSTKSRGMSRSGPVGDSFLECGKAPGLGRHRGLGLARWRRDTSKGSPTRRRLERSEGRSSDGRHLRRASFTRIH